jgi:prevent-host-death family protein
MQRWQMQTAKARFSELVKHAAQEGPQEITLHGQSVAVVVSRKLFDQLSGNEQSLVDFMRASPLAGREDVDLERDRGPGSLPREIRF